MNAVGRTLAWPERNSTERGGLMSHFAVGRPPDNHRMSGFLNSPITSLRVLRQHTTAQE